MRFIFPVIFVAICVFQVEGSAATHRSLSQKLKFNDNVDILDTLAHVLVGLSRNPQNGRIKYQTADLFFRELGKVAPRFAQALRMVAKMMRISGVGGSRKRDVLLRKAFRLFRNKDSKHAPGFSRHSFDNHVQGVRDGNLDAAKTIVNTLASQFLDFQNLKTMDRGSILEKVARKMSR